jgi:hypothetical protein
VEQVPHKSAARLCAYCTTEEKALHSRTQVGTRDLEQAIKMLAGDDAAEQLPVLMDYPLLHAVDDPASIGIVAHSLLPRISIRHYVIDGAVSRDPKSWHVPIAEARLTDGPA